MKKIAIAGCTGSIGVSSLEVIRQLGNDYQVTALSAHRNTDLLTQQLQYCSPETVVITDETACKNFTPPSSFRGKILCGTEGLLQMAAEADYDIFIGAMVGFAGLAPTVEAIKRGKRIALANKETLVVAGELITSLCAEYGAELLPVDSEHSAIYQCLVGEQIDEVDRLILTASGGPFLGKKSEDLHAITAREALKHPTWSMGAKITIDSATLMNKGLEVIEARWLFHIPPEKIDVIVHPQSIIHSMVEFTDGSIKAQLSSPDMKLPIQYALTYPARGKQKSITTDFLKIGKLEFFQPDTETFRCLRLAYHTLKSGGIAPCILNAANEIAVDRFLKGSIRFPDIPRIIEHTLEKISNHLHPDLDTIIQCNSEARNYAANF